MCSLREIVADDGDHADVGVQLRRQREVRRRAAEHPLGLLERRLQRVEASEPTTMRLVNRSPLPSAPWRRCRLGRAGCAGSAAAADRGREHCSDGRPRSRRPPMTGSTSSLSLQADVVVRDQRDPDVTDLQLAGEHLLRELGHVDRLPSPAEENQRLSARVEKRGPWITTTVPRSWTVIPSSRPGLDAQAAAAPGSTARRRRYGRPAARRRTSPRGRRSDRRTGRRPRSRRA